MKVNYLMRTKLLQSRLSWHLSSCSSESHVVHNGLYAAPQDSLVLYFEQYKTHVVRQKSARMQLNVFGDISLS